MQKIPLVDLKAQYKSIKNDLEKAIKKVIGNTNFIMGEEVEVFEQAFSKFLGINYAIGVSSGTDAIHLALYALGIGKGDEVILPAHTFTASAEPIIWLGAKPVFVDIDAKTYTIDPVKIREKITSKTKAIIPIHLYGHPADLLSIFRHIEKIKQKIYIVEDCAQAHGAEVKMRLRHLGGDRSANWRTPEVEELKCEWKKVGSIGDIGCFSFYPGKNLGAYGDAGMVVTNNEKLAEKLRLLRNHGRREKYIHEMVGFGDRLDTLQAAILLTKLKYLEKWNKQRRQHATLYTKLLSGIKKVTLPYQASWAKSVYHLYVVRVEERDRLKRYLQDKGIETGIHYPIPLHLQPAYYFLDYNKGDLPVTEKIVNEIISLPIYPEMTKQQINFVCKWIKEFYS